MKAAIVMSCILSIFSTGPQAEDFYTSPTYSQLRDDYNQVSLVARVLTEDTIPLNNQGSYYEFIARGKVIEAFKGAIRKGQKIEYYVRAEVGYDHKVQRGDRIVFLIQRFNKATRKYSYQELENSMHAYSLATVAKLRRLKRLQKRRAACPVRDEAEQLGYRSGGCTPLKLSFSLRDFR